MEINDIKKTRWNFIGLSSEEKPVPETSPDVVNGNDAAGGYINTDGWTVIWTNNKLATNNYQVRISATYLLA